ncbi:MAG: multidrug effflux MFS transporter [Pseudomonadota bacterium]
MTAVPKVIFLDRTTPPHIVTLVMLAGVGAMNMSVLLPSLPAMTLYFDTDYAVMQLSVSLYLAMTAGLQLFIGPMSDRFGRRRVMLVCLGIFLVATLGCMLSPTAEIFLTFRMLQGAVAVGLVLSRAIVRDMVPQDQAASMIGYVTMGMALVPMFAPMIGGALDQLFGWHATFGFMLAIGLAVLVLAYWDQGETFSGQASSFAQQFSEAPELLRSRRFWGYVFAAAFAAGAFFAFLGGAPYVASEVFGLSSFWSGVGFGAPAIGYAFGNFLSGRYSTTVGVNTMILYGTLATTIGMAGGLTLVLLGFDSAVLFFGTCTTVGLGNGLVMPNTAAGMLSVRPKLAGTASGLGSAILIGGGAGLSALAGFALKFGTTSAPLQIIMFCSSAMALVSILYVRKRAVELAAA